MPIRAPKRPIIEVTAAACAQIKQLVLDRGKETTLGIVISVEKKGCSGNAYKVSYLDASDHELAQCYDEQLNYADFTIFIDPKAKFFIIGTIMDYVVEKLHAGFIFRNPNEKGKCGCGESFHV